MCACVGMSWHDVAGFAGVPKVASVAGVGRIGANGQEWPGMACVADVGRCREVWVGVGW